jgi:hypothetical protein
MQNQIQALAILPKLSEQQLVQALQGGRERSTAYAVMAELEARKKRAAGFAGTGGPPRTSVKQDMVQQASGIQSLGPQPAAQPSPMAQPQQMQQRPMGMAAGGMIPGYAAGDLIGDPYEGYAIAPGPQPNDPDWWQHQLDASKAVQFLKRLRSGATPVGITGAEEGRPDVAPSGPSAPPDVPYTGKDALLRRGAVTSPTSLPAPAVKPPVKAPPGIGSISASVGSRTGATGATDTSFTPAPLKPRSLSEIMKEIPQDSAIQEQIDAIKNSDKSEQNKKQAIGMMLLNWGAKTAATAGPTLSALGTGAQDGLRAYAEQDALNRREENERRRELGLLAIGQGGQKVRNYEVARKQQMDEVGMQDKANDNLFAAKKLAVESGDRALDRAAQIQVAGIHATAAKASQLDYNMQRLVQTTQSQASDDFDKMTTTGMGSIKYGRMDPAQLNGLRQAYIAERLKTIPGISKYWVAPPTAQAPGFMAEPPGGVKVFGAK